MPDPEEPRHDLAATGNPHTPTPGFGLLPEGAKRAVKRMLQAPNIDALADPQKSTGQCFRAARAFASALREEGEPESLIQFAGDGGFHQVTAIAHPAAIDDETIVVDWTPRQFDPHSPTPLIETFGDMKRRHGNATAYPLDATYFEFIARASPEPSDAPNDWTWEETQRYLESLKPT